MTQLLSFLAQNSELLISVIVGLVGLLKLTSWGRAQAQALDAVVAVIEGFGSKEIKTEIRARELSLPRASSQAIKDSVSVADPKKPTRGIGTRIFRALFKGILFRD